MPSSTTSGRHEGREMGQEAVQGFPPVPPLQRSEPTGLYGGAGDRDRTGMTSLEGVPQRAVMGADLGIRLTSGSRY